MALSISEIVKGEGPLPPKKIEQLKRWLDDDWEADDMDRDMLKVIRRLLLNLEASR